MKHHNNSWSFLLLLLIVLAFLNEISSESVSDLLQKSLIKTVGRSELSSGFSLSDWPGTGVMLKISRISSRNCIVHLKYNNCGSCKYFILPFVDGARDTAIEISSKSGFETSITLPYTKARFSYLQVLKMTEAAYSEANGIMELLDISIDGGSFLKITDSSLKFLFVGDSITAAYGVDGVPPCSFSASTENVFDGYGYAVASYFNASADFVAWSGKGVVRNYGDSNKVSVDPLPYFYNRTLGSSSQYYWSSVSQPANVVYVMLGSNDYSTEPTPDDDVFTQGLIDFLQVIQKDHPGAKIFAACSPSQKKNQCQNILRATQVTQTYYVYLDPSLKDAGLGCDSHPNIASQENIANAVITALSPILL